MKSAIGIKIRIGKDLVGDYPFDKFLEKATCDLKGIGIMGEEDNKLTCRFYDEDSGDIYFTFEREINKDLLKRYFSKNEILEKIEK